MPPNSLFSQLLTIKEQILLSDYAADVNWNNWSDVWNWIWTLTKVYKQHSPANC